MDFTESYNYLLSLGNEVTAMKLGLENIRILLAALGNPQKRYLKVQIAGTNGKGSVCAFLEAICLSAGIRTGLTTSPHLVSITERVRINGQNISEAEFAAIATRVRETAEKLVAAGELETVPTYFEQVTTIALLAFAEAKVELAILETGLGGRFDATTAANAEIAAITRVDLDHQKYLGNTIGEIAAEKAAIIRPEMIVIVGEQQADAMKVILDACKEAAIIPKMADAAAIGRKLRSDGPIGEGGLDTFQLGLLGKHQFENASISVALAEGLRKCFEITDENILRGLETARNPGRLELQGRYLFDGAHNVGGAKALRAYLNENVDRPIVMIFGAMNDKDVREIGEILFPKADTLVLTEPSNARALSAHEIGRQLSEITENAKVVKTSSVREALEIAEQLSTPDSIVLITGSLYLIGEAKGILNN